MRDLVGIVTRGASLVEVVDDQGAELRQDGLLIEDGIPAIVRTVRGSHRRWLVDCDPSDNVIVTVLPETPAHISVGVRRCVNPRFASVAYPFMRNCFTMLRAVYGHNAALGVIAGAVQDLRCAWQDVGGSHGDQVIGRGGDLIVVSSAPSIEQDTVTEEVVRGPMRFAAGAHHLC